MTILAIDPGTEESGWCLYRDGKVVEAGTYPNTEVLERLGYTFADVLAVEMIASYGMAVGKEVFATCVWIGRFIEAWKRHSGMQEPEHRLVYRQEVKLHLCKSVRAKDANVRQALIDLLGPQGTKKEPGPTYGVKSHAWAALAVAVTVQAQIEAA